MKPEISPVPDVPPADNYPSGLVTFLFTDVEGSTRIWDENDSLAHRIMSRHDEILESHVKHHNGFVVRPRGEGDSRFVVFRLPADAVAASIAIQKSIASENWGLPDPLRIRMAVHTGEGVFQAGDYYGKEVNRCARVRSLAHGGQVLVTASTHDLVKGFPIEGVNFRDLGTYRLRGLREPEQIYQLVIPGMINDFPPLHVDRSVFEDPPKEQIIQFCTTPDGVNLAYASTGNGPTIVKAANWLNHLEFDWQSPIWRHWLAAFSEHHRLVRYDERGSGLSDWEADDLSFESWVRDLETVVDAAGLDRFCLLGISQGGAVSLAYAVRHPERVSQLILYGTYTQGWRKRSEPLEIRQREAMIMLTETGWGADNPAYRQVFTSRFMPEANSEQMRWFNDLQKNTTSPENAVKLQLVTADIDVSDLAPKIEIPTLVLHARQDGTVPFNEGKRMASLIPGARFVSLESKNHILLETEPAWGKFLNEVNRFLEDG